MDLSNLPNLELAKRFDQISQLAQEEQAALIMMMDAFVKKHRFETIVHS